MKTSIVILTCNGIELLKKCIESVHRFTVVPYKLYVVDQGSTDGTLQWLNNFTKSHALEVLLIPNKENVGFPRGCNQVFEIVAEDRVCLLNNDTIVSPRWLLRLAAKLDERHLVVGPSTNRCGWRQKLVEYVDLPVDISAEKVAQRAEEVYQKYKNQTRVLTHLSGFCMLFTKSTLDHYGPFDEDYLLGGGEEVDFCWKITTDGKKCLWVKDVYVHHVHHATFDILGIDMKEYRSKTSTILAEKWPQDVRPKF